MARYALWDLIQATIAVRLIVTVAKAVLVPAYADDNLIPASEETRNYLLIWVRRFACWGIFGYALAAATWWLGVPGGIYALLLKISALVLAILGIVFILQNRAVVAGWIKGSDSGEPAGFSRVRRRIGEIWHILAIVYIGAIYLTYALRVEGGSGFILRATLVSLVVIVGARLLVRFIEELSARGFAIAPELRARFPELEKRTNRYTPILTGLASVAIYALLSFSCCRPGTSDPSPGSRPDWGGKLREPYCRLRLCWRSRSPFGSFFLQRSNAISQGSTPMVRRAAPAGAHCCRCCELRCSASLSRSQA